MTVTRATTNVIVVEATEEDTRGRHHAGKRRKRDPGAQPSLGPEEAKRYRPRGHAAPEKGRRGDRNRGPRPRDLWRRWIHQPQGERDALKPALRARPGRSLKHTNLVNDSTREVSP